MECDAVAVSATLRKRLGLQINENWTYPWDTSQPVTNGPHGGHGRSERAPALHCMGLVNHDPTYSAFIFFQKLLEQGVVQPFLKCSVWVSVFNIEMGFVNTIILIITAQYICAFKNKLKFELKRLKNKVVKTIETLIWCHTCPKWPFLPVFFGNYK